MGQIRTGQIALFYCVALISACHVDYAIAQLSAWKPQKHVEIVVGVSPGGGQDQTARVIQRIIQKGRLVDSPSTVMNKPGGGGTISLAYMNQHIGDPHYLLLSSPPLLGNHITGKSPLTFTDFTPIVQLLSEYVAFSVSAVSPIMTGKDLVEQMKAAPLSLNFSVGTSLGNQNHLAVARVAKMAGLDVRKLKTVVFRTSGEGVTALIGGHIQVVLAPASVIASQVQAGKARIIAIAAPHRLRGVLSNVPTWREQGLDVVLSSDRGVIGPKGIRTEEIAYWEKIFREVTQTEEWKDELQRNFWVDNYLRSEESKMYLKSVYEELKSSLTELGLAK